MPTTPKGLPYPDGNTLLSELDLAIKALAEAVDGKLTTATAAAAGTRAVTVAAANTLYTAAVTFPVGRFTAPPAVVVSTDAGNPDTAYVSADTITKDGFTLRWRRTNTSAMTCHWIARATG
jgi:hypothetical protein